jgi:hypothetical protein
MKTPLRRTPGQKLKYKAEQDAIDKGYTFLGWQATAATSFLIRHCQDLGHQRAHVYHTAEGADQTLWCDASRFYYKINGAV